MKEAAYERHNTIHTSTYVSQNRCAIAAAAAMYVICYLTHFFLAYVFVIPIAKIVLVG